MSDQPKKRGRPKKRLDTTPLVNEVESTPNNIDEILDDINDSIGVAPASPSQTTPDQNDDGEYKAVTDEDIDAFLKELNIPSEVKDNWVPLKEDVVKDNPTPTTHKPISILDNYTDLENDIKPEVKEALVLLTTELPKPEDEMSIDELEQHLLNMNDLYYKVARMKRKGKSEHTIAKELGLPVTQVSKMIRQFLNLGYRLLPKETAELRTEVLHQLDDFMQGLYQEANQDGYSNLTSKQMSSALGIIDRKMKLLNITPPTQVQLTVSEEIMQAKTQLDKIFSTYKMDIIDVTPKEKDE